MSEQVKQVEPPIGKDGKPQTRFEVRKKMIGWHMDKKIFLNGELFDWEIDKESLIWAIAQGPVFAEAARQDIEKHFLECLSEILGKRITNEDVKEATKTGWI
jgi:hypothetical protein